MRQLGSCPPGQHHPPTHPHALTFSCSMCFLCCRMCRTSRGRSGIPFPASTSCTAAYSRAKAPVRPTPELRQEGV